VHCHIVEFETTLHTVAVNAFVMVKFTNDTVVVPRESEWFGFYGENGKAIVPLENSPLYTEDWLGLKAMNEVCTDTISTLLTKVAQSIPHMDTIWFASWLRILIFPQSRRNRRYTLQCVGMRC